MEITFTTRWLYENMEGRQVPAGSNVCAVCGLPMQGGIETNKVFRPTFTDYQSLRKADSKFVCEACAWYFDNQKIRSTGWVLSKNEANAMGRADWLPFLQNAIAVGMPKNGYVLIRPGGMAGKHLALYAQMTFAGRREISVRWNVNNLVLHADWLRMALAAHALRERHSWAEIEGDSYNAKFTAAWGPQIGRFAELRNLVHPWLDTPYFDLAKFVWTKGEN